MFAACAAIVRSASVVETVEAYPITARSGSTTVTSTNRRLGLELFVVKRADARDDGCNGFGYGNFNLTLRLSGSFIGTGTSFIGTGTSYTGVTVNAGTWSLNIPSWRASATDDSANTIEVSRNVDFAVGTSTYLGGGYSGMPYEDQGQFDDQFSHFAPTGSPFMQATCENGAAMCSRFLAVLLQELQHIGPDRPVGE